MVKRYISIDEHGYSCAEECQHGDLVDYGDYAAVAERCERLEAALRELAEANFAEFCGDHTEKLEPDDSKVSYPEDRCNITFGMIRRALYLLEKRP